MGKSAQVPLHTWLPDAMEGPTPVSALIHAATMVTAGVFMVARLSPLFEGAPHAQTVVIAVGATTAFFAATVGLVQNDIKRVVAYSTCSQLGYMFVGLGVGAYSAGIFHLFTHAFFKALLFLGAGSVIHAMHHEQDMRHMGGLRRCIPVTYWMMVIGTLSLTGFPFTAGYYSKDAIIEAAYASGAPYGLFGFVLTVFAAFLTSFYSWRLIFLVFHGERRWPQAHPGAHAHGEEALHDHAPDHGDVPHESPPVMTIPLAVLAFGALVAGLAFHNGFVGHGAEAFWRESLAPSHVLDAMHHLAWWVSALPTLMMLLGFGLAYLFYIARPELPAELARSQDVLYAFLLNKWYFDEIYDVLFVRPARFIGRVFWRVGDQRIIDGLGPDGIAARVLDITRGVVRIQTGYVYHYAFAMLIGVAILLTWYMFSAGVH
jgi:NADH-quinone oxidoreductase subunit L